MPLEEVINETQPPHDQRPRGGGRFRGGDNTTPSTRVYVGNLAWQTSWQDLKDHMRKAGNVKRADVFVDEQGRSKGCGIVEFDTPEEAQNAIRMLNDTKVDDTDRLIFVREDREDRGFSQSIIQRGGRRVGGSKPRFASNERNSNGGGRAGGSTHGRQVFVGNLPYTTSWQDLKDLFRQCGNVIRADVMLDAAGRSKGQGIVLFESSNEAQRAINMFDNTEYQNRLLAVHEDKFA